MVTRLTRAQLHLYTTEGESVTSTRLMFDGRDNEYLTIESLAYLFGFTENECYEFCKASGLTVRQLDGVRWLNCSDLMPLFGWTPSVKRDIVD